jgi:hypothetical protein
MWQPPSADAFDLESETAGPAATSDADSPEAVNSSTTGVATAAAAAPSSKLAAVLSNSALDSPLPSCTPWTMMDLDVADAAGSKDATTELAVQVVLK